MSKEPNLSGTKLPEANLTGTIMPDGKTASNDLIKEAKADAIGKTPH